MEYYEILMEYKYHYKYHEKFIISGLDKLLQWISLNEMVSKFVCGQVNKWTQTGLTSLSTLHIFQKRSHPVDVNYVIRCHFTNNILQNNNDANNREMTNA